MSKQLQIVIPMAGRGSRFSDAGYTLPKPMIPVHGRPMLEVVISNVRPDRDHRFVFICLEDHLKAFDLTAALNRWAPGCEIVPIRQVTEGAACTVLLAKKLINSGDPLMIANSDQWVDVNINDYLRALDVSGDDGLIMTMKADHPKWSYVRMDAGRVTEVVEKKVVSDEATVGIYNYREGRLFVEAAERMIADNLRVNGEFYVAPAYNEMIRQGQRIGIYNVGKEWAGMYGLGTPADLTHFLTLPVSQQAALR